MSLSQYHKKRDFSKTPEPKGEVTSEPYRLFVLQKHAASHLHYDFRLELDGVLKSWAIPKGPSLDPQVKRLAMQVEDHPVAYGSFEGIIPKGQYGGGTVMLWDKGTWHPLDDDPIKAYKKGHLRFELRAEKLHGRWDLIRFKEDSHWFLIKYQDKYVRSQEEYDITKAQNKSILSNGTIEQIAEHYEYLLSVQEAAKVKAKKQGSKLKKSQVLLPAGLKKIAFPKFISPQLATLVDKPPEGQDWLHEIKYDGYRILAFKNGSNVVLKSRTNKDWSTDFPSIVHAVSQLPFEQIILDGELVVLDEDGRSNFQLLQNAIKDKNTASFIYFLFDLLYFNGYDLRNLALIERKAILKNILTNTTALLHYSDHIVQEGNELFEHACHYALEGIVCKKSNGAYYAKRSNEWLKVKCSTRQEFVIGGYTQPKGRRAHFGSLFLGTFNNKGTLEFAGNVGTGFNESSLNEVYQLLLANKGQFNPFTSKPPGSSNACWVKPNLVCEVEFTQWTKEGHLRHPSFKGMRLDKKASEVLREVETPLAEIKTEQPRNKKEKTVAFSITHPDKILYSEDKITKQDVFDYYETVSDYILPYLALRPLTLVRCTSHYDQCFYQRHFNAGMQKALHPVEEQKDKGKEQYIYLNDKTGLLSLVQMGVLEIHPWGSTIKHLEQPDIMVIDLDPAPNVPWKKVVASAKAIRDHLAQYQLRSFVKTTGGKGLHVVVPILPEYEWDEVKEFTHIFVAFLEQLNPQDYISTMTKSKRTGKIFIDYLRNQRTSTAIAPYSTRARLHAPVATPLSWDELSNSRNDNFYTIKTLPKRLEQLTADPWNEFWNLKQSLRLNDLEEP